MECFLTKGIFEAAKTSHQRKQILLGVERKLSVAPSLRCYGIVTKLIGLFPLFFQVKVYVAFSCVCQHCKKQIILRHRFFFRCSSVDAKVCVVSRGIRKEAEQNTVTAQPCRCSDVPESKTQSIGTKLCVRERDWES